MANPSDPAGIGSPYFPDTRPPVVPLRQQAAASLDPDAPVDGRGITQDEYRRFVLHAEIPPAVLERLEKLVIAWRIFTEDHGDLAESIYRLAEAEYADNLDAQAEAHAENSAMRGAEGGRL